MVKEITTFGSCSSRNIFASLVNEGYKDFFHINFSVQSVSLISLMSKPVRFDSNLLNSPEEYDNICVNNDLTKEYLDFIKKANLDYLIFDTFFDVYYSVIAIDNETFITDSDRLMHMDLANQFKDYERINIQDNFYKYIEIWKCACDSFFKFICNECNDLKVILNCSRPVYNYFSSSDNGIVESLKLKKQVPIYHNHFRDILDSYILENYDVFVLPFDDTTLANENHVWGFHPTHYEPRYYKEKTMQINNIIEFNEFEGGDFNKASNIKLRESIRENSIEDIKNNALLKFNSLKNMKLFETIYKYITARIDIKNEGNVSNKIEILQVSDDHASIMFPNWFCDVLGEGVSIRSAKGKLNLKIKCINDGNLIMRFMGMDIHDDSGNRVPIYIKFTDIIINGEKINENDKIVWHDDFFMFKKKVINSEIVTLDVSWVMF